MDHFRRRVVTPGRRCSVVTLGLGPRSGHDAHGVAREGLAPNEPRLARCRTFSGQGIAGLRIPSVQVVKAHLGPYRRLNTDIVPRTGTAPYIAWCTRIIRASGSAKYEHFTRGVKLGAYGWQPACGISESLTKLSHTHLSAGEIKLPLSPDLSQIIPALQKPNDLCYRDSDVTREVAPSTRALDMISRAGPRPTWDALVGIAVRATALRSNVTCILGSKPCPNGPGVVRLKTN